MTVVRHAAKVALQTLGVLDPLRRVLAPARVVLRRRGRMSYYRRLVGVYRDPLHQFSESYAAFDRREREASERGAAERYRADQEAVVSSALTLLTGSEQARQGTTEWLRTTIEARYSGVPLAAERMRATLASLAGLAVDSSWRELDEAIANLAVAPRAGALPVAPPAGSLFESDCAELATVVIRRLVDRDIAPRFYDYDYIEDIVGIIGGRYCSDSGPAEKYSRRMLEALCALAGSTAQDLPARLRSLLGPGQQFLPVRGDVTHHVRNVIPDLAEEFIRLRGEDNVERFLEINRQYSKRQAVKQGIWDSRDVSLLRGHERDHHLVLRTLIALVARGSLTADDEVLLVGPRHVDEVVFFRECLGLPRTIGLDLFDFGDNMIRGGDMHHMPFEPGTFGLIYCAGTLGYSYNARRVIQEMTRTLKRPGYVALLDAAGRTGGPDALGRSDVVSVDTLIGMFHEHAFTVVAKDAGRTLVPHQYENYPCLVLRLDAPAEQHA